MSIVVGASDLNAYLGRGRYFHAFMLFVHSNCVVGALGVLGSLCRDQHEKIISKKSNTEGGL